MHVTPLHLEILLHYYVSNEPFIYSSETIATYHDHLVDNGLLDVFIEGSGSSSYNITEKGKVWIEKILSTPLPVHRWICE